MALNNNQLEQKSSQNSHNLEVNQSLSNNNHSSETSSINQNSVLQIEPNKQKSDLEAELLYYGKVIIGLGAIGATATGFAVAAGGLFQSQLGKSTRHHMDSKNNFSQGGGIRIVFKALFYGTALSVCGTLALTKGLMLATGATNTKEFAQVLESAVHKVFGKTEYKSSPEGSSDFDLLDWFGIKFMEEKLIGTKLSSENENDAKGDEENQTNDEENLGNVSDFKTLDQQQKANPLSTNPSQKSFSSIISKDKL